MLNDQDIELLMQGLDAIEKSESMSGLMGEMLGTMMARGDKDFLSKIDEDRRMAEFRRKQEKQLRREQVIMLKAKLVHIRQSVTAERFLDDASK